MNLKFGDEFRSVPKTNGRFVLVSDEPSQFQEVASAGLEIQDVGGDPQGQR